jgi:hypothetical protein
MDSTISLEIIEVVEQAAIASSKWMGLGKKDEADEAAVEAMRERMNKIHMRGRIVIGEGERDEAPMLYIGEEVGICTQANAAEFCTIEELQEIEFDGEEWEKEEQHAAKVKTYHNQNKFFSKQGGINAQFRNEKGDIISAKTAANLKSTFPFLFLG